MADSPHLFEADKVRIANEAKVRTALEQPDFAEREFEKWRAQEDRQIKDESFVTAWAKVAWLAEGCMYAMGRELDKLQKRIGRQRKVNRRQHHALKAAHERIERLEKERDRFHYWAENLASHGFNVTAKNGGNDEFHPLAAEYWDEMSEQRVALSGEEKEA